MKAINNKFVIGLKDGSVVKVTKATNDTIIGEFPIYPANSADNSAPVWVKIFGQEKVDTVNSIMKSGDKNIVASLDFKTTFYKKDGETTSNTEVIMYGVSKAENFKGELGYQPKGKIGFHRQLMNLGGEVKVEEKDGKSRASGAYYSAQGKDADGNKIEVENQAAVFITGFGDTGKKMKELSEIKVKNSKNEDSPVGVLVTGSISYTKDAENPNKSHMNIVAINAVKFDPKSEAEATAENAQEEEAGEESSTSAAPGM